MAYVHQSVNGGRCCYPVVDPPGLARTETKQEGRVTNGIELHATILKRFLQKASMHWGSYCNRRGRNFPRGISLDLGLGPDYGEQMPMPVGTAEDTATDRHPVKKNRMHLSLFIDQNVYE